MEKLVQKKISVDDAKAQASMAKQVNNLLKYELDRVKTLMKVEDFNKANQSDFKIREIEEDLGIGLNGKTT